MGPSVCGINNVILSISYNLKKQQYLILDELKMDIKNKFNLDLSRE